MELRGWNVVDEERAVLWREFIVPAHGPAVTTANLAAEARAQIARL